MKKEEIILIEKMNPIKGNSYNNIDEKIKFFIDNLQKIPVVNYKLSFIQHCGFTKISEVRYNNNGVKDDLGLGKSELDTLIDSLFREYELEETIFSAILSVDSRVSYIAFFIREEKVEETESE